jgi:hypothetical protein
MGITNSIPYIVAVCIIMIKNKVLSKQSSKKRNYVFYCMCFGLVFTTAYFHFDYWRQIYCNAATSTISLSIPLIIILSLLAIPLFYEIGKLIYTLVNKKGHND